MAPNRAVSQMHYLSSADFFTSNVLNNPLHKTSVVGKTLAGVDINYINEKKRRLRQNIILI